MALGRKGLTWGAVKGLTVCCFTNVLLGGGGGCFTVSTLIRMAVLPISVPKLTGEESCIVNN
ncbi:unnamed protein product, partial [Staurois parvus]